MKALHSIKVKVNPKNITLKSLSLGDAVVAYVTAYFHAQGHKINLFNDRYFSSITDVLVGHAVPHYGMVIMSAYY